MNFYKTTENLYICSNIVNYPKHHHQILGLEFSTESVSLENVEIIEWQRSEIEPYLRMPTQFRLYSFGRSLPNDVVTQVFSRFNEIKFSEDLDFSISKIYFVKHQTAFPYMYADLTEFLVLHYKSQKDCIEVSLPKNTKINGKKIGSEISKSLQEEIKSEFDISILYTESEYKQILTLYNKAKREKKHFYEEDRINFSKLMKYNYIIQYNKYWENRNIFMRIIKNCVNGILSPDEFFYWFDRFRTELKKEDVINVQPNRKAQKFNGFIKDIFSDYDSFELEELNDEKFDRDSFKISLKKKFLKMQKYLD